MKGLYWTAGLLAAGLLVLSCGGGPPQGVGEAPCPEWFSNPPQDPDFLYATATAVSRDLQLALNKAKTEARAELASQLEVRMQGLRKKFDEEVGLGEDAQLLSMYTQATKEVISQVMVGSRIAKQYTKKEGTGWRACVLMELPIGAANKALVDRIKANEQMYTRFRASQTFKELEEEVKKFEEYKKEHGM
ncbi:MAG: hypothetical protein DRP94_09675 [Candidatus Latescibacterota bacterium]|nr:MAG: hypothetical protein DRP94_09675 [Candidatus Latescibacterota bacterium]